MGRDLFSFLFSAIAFRRINGRHLFYRARPFEELERRHFFGSEKNVQDTGVFFQNVTVFFNTLGVLIQETLGARFGLNKEFKSRR